MKAMYSMRSPAVKRLMKEAQELREPTELYYAQPLEDNLFEWHFTIRGPENSDFDGGLYHGRIILPAEYPMKPPNVILLTPNGRFETNKKICLSISGHHPESWQPSWSIRTALLAIIGFMPTHGGGAIGSLDYPSEDRKKLAKRSVEWKCEHCGSVSYILKAVTEASKAENEEAKELASQINFRGEKQGAENKSQSESSTASPGSTPVTTPPNTPVATNQTFPNMPTMPGQLPFPAFPFPPFGNMPNFPQQNQQQQGSNFVPRFPFPPQFSPAMFQQMMMPFGNPFLPGAQNTPPSMPIQPSSSSANISTSQSSGYGQSVVSRSQNTFSNSSGATSSAASSSSSSRSVNPTVSSSSETIGQQSHQPLPPSPSTPEGLRQRIAESRQQFSQQLRSYVEQPADLEPENRQSGFRLSTILIIMLLIVIALLVLRRVYLQRMWRFPF